MNRDRRIMCTLDISTRFYTWFTVVFYTWFTTLDLTYTWLLSSVAIECIGIVRMNQVYGQWSTLDFFGPTLDSSSVEPPFPRWDAGVPSPSGEWPRHSLWQVWSNDCRHDCSWPSLLSQTLGRPCRPYPRSPTHSIGRATDVGLETRQFKIKDLIGQAVKPITSRVDDLCMSHSLPVHEWSSPSRWENGLY